MKTINGEIYLKVSEVANLTGINKHTIQFYNSKNLLPPVFRTAKNMVYYPEITVTILNIIKYLQERLSYSIDNIINLFSHYRINLKAKNEIIKSSLEILSFGLFQVVDPTQVPNLKKAIDLGLVEDKHFYFIKELDAVHVMNKLLSYDFGENLISSYISFAKQVSSFEKTLADTVVASDIPINELDILDIMHCLKPFIFNKATSEVFNKEL